MRRTILGAVGLAVLLGLLWFGVVGASGIKNLRMSDAPDGPALTDFPSGTETVYVVFDYLDLAAETIRVRVYDHEGVTLLDRTDTYSGSGTASIAVHSGGEPFPDGPYVTTLYFASGYLSKALEWTVGGADQPPTPTPLPPTALQVEPTSLTLEVPQGGPNPPAQRVLITNAGGGLLLWSASKDANWLRIRPSSGAAPALLRVSARVDGLPAGTYEGHITISGDATVLNSPQTVSVTLTIAPPEGSVTTAITPLSTHVGWVVSGETTGNHFGEEEIRAGFYGGEVYYGAVQFDLSSVPPEAQINAASVEFTGRSAEFLGDGGFWRLRLLDASVDEDWATHVYTDVHEAPVVETIPPPLSSADLGVGVVNIFAFTADQLDLLETRLANKAVSFRLDGPMGEDNLFVWDSGYDAERAGARPVLRINYTLVRPDRSGTLAGSFNRPLSPG
ncbi:MAG TPA: hypothetical protein EYP55_11770 [Anaerolineae bacterium]|nr:hypothetical protein [Anaerolineae bacterium]